MKTFTTDLIKAETVQELEAKAVEQAKAFFGPDAVFKIRDYQISHYGLHTSSPGAYITLELQETPEMPSKPCYGDGCVNTCCRAGKCLTAPYSPV